jgi:TolB-like protein
MAQTDDQLWVLAGLGFVALVLALIVRQLARGRPEPLPANGPLRLLIRPLKELKPDPNHLYLGNTIARELSVALKGFDRMEPAVGDAASGLSIDGTVRKTGPRLLINIRLLSGRHPLWTGTYDGAINDLARMEGEIVSNVARVLKLVARKAPAAADAPVSQ